MFGLRVLSFVSLLGFLQGVIATIKDPRQPSNGTKYTVKDALLSAFSAFFMQCESFLDHQRQMQAQRGRDNAQTLFEIEQIPSDNQIRNILDEIAASILFPIFNSVYESLQAGGYLKSYQCLGGHLLVALDGSEYFSSERLHCPNCSHRTHKNGVVSYFHRAIFPVIVAPGHENVLALAPEFITPQDGYEKQDSEQAAAKRWLKAHAAEFSVVDMTVLGDDLYSRQPMCELVLQQGFNFIFTCLPESHSTLYDWLDYLEANGEVQTIEQRQWNGRYEEISSYRYVNQIPLRDTQPALLVNWCQLTITKASDDSIIYRNAFITQHGIRADNVADVVEAGRARWKVENENNNVLKTKGYHLEHNFGHGQKHLSSILVTLNLLAFLFHTVLQLVDQSYQQIRKRRVTRKTFFNDIRTLTTYLLFDSWQHLITFMISESTPWKSPNTS